MNTALKIFVLAFLAAGVPGISSAQVRQYSARAVEEYPHDVTSYTQGLGIFGAGVEYAYDTVFGPLSASLHWSSLTHKMGFYVGFGYYF